MDAICAESSLLIFDPNDGGHHAGYILHFLKYACRQPNKGTIYLAVPPSLMSLRGEVHDAVQDCASFHVTSIPLQGDLFVRFQRSESLLLRTWLQWRLLQEAIRNSEPDCCLVMYVDHLLLPLAIGLMPGCELSGIYFRPTFHYSQFSSFSPTLSDRVRSLRQQALVWRALRSPALRHLFCLDPFVPEVINAMVPIGKAIALPEPVQVYRQVRSNPSSIRQRLGIDSGRIVFLLFGVISKRKGVIELLDACRMIHPHEARKITLLLVGPADSDLAASFVGLIDGSNRNSSIQILLRDIFVPDSDIQLYFEAADVVLTPYQRHVGMSAVLVRSAAAGKPIISSGYGLIGEIVRVWNLGVTLESTEPASIARGIEQAVLQNGKVPFDRDSAKRFAEINSAEAFGEVLYRHLLDSGS